MLLHLWCSDIDNEDHKFLLYYSDYFQNNLLARLIYGVLDVPLLRWPLESLLGAKSTKRYTLIAHSIFDLFVFHSILLISKITFDLTLVSLISEDFAHTTLMTGYIQVAALFYIGTTKSHPPIPAHLSAEAKDFLLKCLQKYIHFSPADPFCFLYSF